MTLQSTHSTHPIMREWLWTALLTAGSVAFSLILACATPFAALGSLAALRLEKRTALLLVIQAWLANQLVGYLILHYPRDLNSYAWGAAIGIAFLASVMGAGRIRAFVGRRETAISLVGTLLAAFVAYEAILWLASLTLASGPEAFSLHVMARAFVINAGAFIGLLALQRIAIFVGFLPAASPARPSFV